MPYVSPRERERLNEEKKAKQTETEKYAYHPGPFGWVDEHARSVAQIPFYDWEGETAPVKEGFEYWTERERSEVPGNEYSLSFHEKYEVAHLLDRDPYGTDTAKLLDNIESKLIDMVYGTDRNMTLDAGEDPELAGAIARGEDVSMWGLDWRRVNPPEPLEFGSSDWFNYYVLGEDKEGNEVEINWNSYQTDPRFQVAFKQLGYNIDDLTEVEPELAQSWVRHANQKLAGDEYNTRIKTSGTWKHYWPDQYDKDKIQLHDGDLYVDGQRQKTLDEKYAAGRGRLNITHHFEPLAQKAGRRSAPLAPDIKIPEIFSTKLTNEQAGIPTTMGST